tara:strand:- start:1446 stop:1721 length:276 start_codon:yes stop_codon:yes gene_type:complete
MLEFITVYNLNDAFYVSKVLVNPNHISVVKDCEEYNTYLVEGKMNLDFDKGVRFSEITMSGHAGFQNYIVVGSPKTIMEKLQRNPRRLLRD